MCIFKLSHESLRILAENLYEVVHSLPSLLLQLYLMGLLGCLLMLSYSIQQIKMELGANAAPVLHLHGCTQAKHSSTILTNISHLNPDVNFSA